MPVYFTINKNKLDNNLARSQQITKAENPLTSSSFFRHAQVVSWAHRSRFSRPFCIFPSINWKKSWFFLVKIIFVHDFVIIRCHGKKIVLWNLKWPVRCFNSCFFIYFIHFFHFFQFNWKNSDLSWHWNSRSRRYLLSTNRVPLSRRSCLFNQPLQNYSKAL